MYPQANETFQLETSVEWQKRQPLHFVEEELSGPSEELSVQSEKITNLCVEIVRSFRITNLPKFWRRSQRGPAPENWQRIYRYIRQFRVPVRLAHR